MESRYLYRGKRIDNGKWVEGYLSYPFCTEKGNESYYFYAKDSLDFFCNCVVDASTICQCTGLKDKNGKLIWENDIVKCGNKTELVGWDQNFASWRLPKRGWFYRHIYGDAYSSEDCEVIGNIFDNLDRLDDDDETI